MKTEVCIGIPMGDPAGVGPEIVVMAISRFRPECETTRLVVYGEEAILKEAIQITGEKIDICKIMDPSEAKATDGSTLYLMDQTRHTTLSSEGFERGRISAACGKAAYRYIEAAVEDAMKQKVHVIATTPVNKESFRLGHVPFIGHTEILAGLTNTEDPMTMFEVQNMRVFFLSRHVSLMEACSLVTKERIISYVRRMNEALGQLGIENPRIAIAGLNPHGGEHGLFGDEEDLEIRPAVEALKEEGYQVDGPIGADSVFHLALTGRYDAVLSLYHDQGHIATKTLDFYRTIALTLGLPFLRTSVDHGTALDIAGKAIASPVSMIEAIRLAEKYA